MTTLNDDLEIEVRGLFHDHSKTLAALTREFAAIIAPPRCAPHLGMLVDAFSAVLAGYAKYVAEEFSESDRDWIGFMLDRLTSRVMTALADIKQPDGYDPGPARPERPIEQARSRRPTPPMPGDRREANGSSPPRARSRDENPES